MFIYELSGCGFESRCSHLKFIYCACWTKNSLAFQQIPSVCDIKTHNSSGKKKIENVIISSENNSSFINFKVKSRIELRRPRKKKKKKKEPCDCLFQVQNSNFFNHLWKYVFSLWQVCSRIWEKDGLSQKTKV